MGVTKTYPPNQRPPSPLSPLSPFLYDHSPRIISDRFDKKATDKRLSFCSSDPSLKWEDTIVRRDALNGKLYETHGTQIIYTSYSWSFILHGTSSMIIGLIDGDISGKQEMNIFVDTNSDIIQSLFGSKQRPKEGYVIQVSYDIINGMLLCKNISSESKNCGKEIICCSNINTLKRYKLTILLDKPSTITMF